MHAIETRLIGLLLLARIGAYNERTIRNNFEWEGKNYCFEFEAPKFNSWNLNKAAGRMQAHRWLSEIVRTTFINAVEARR